MLTIIAAVAGVVAAVAGAAAAVYARRQDRMRTDLIVSDVGLLSPNESEKAREDIRLRSQESRGPIPDKVVRVVLENRSRATAFQTTGDVLFDPPNLLQPHVDFLPPGSVLYQGEYQGQTGPYGVGLGVDGPGLRVRPGGRNIDLLVFVAGSGTVRVTCQFSTPTGSAAESQHDLEIPDERESEEGR